MTDTELATGLAQDCVMVLCNVKQLIPVDDLYDADRSRADEAIENVRDLIRSLDRKGKEQT